MREAYRIKGWSLGSEACGAVREIDASEMMNANGEGCRFTGHFDVNKVAGEFSSRGLGFSIAMVDTCTI